MKSEYQFVINLSKPFLNKHEKEELCSISRFDLDWDIITAQIIHHQISAIAYYHLEKNNLCELVPIELFNQLKEKYELNKVNQKLYLKESIPVFESMIKAKLKFCILKGVALQEILYPEYTRIYSDIDILIQRNDYSLVWRIFNNYGFTNDQDLSQIENKRVKLFLLLNTYEFPEFKKETENNYPIYIDVQHTHTLARKMGYLLDSSEDIACSQKMIINDINVPRQDLKYLLIHLCTHAFGDSTTISELILHKGFRLRNFGDIIGLVEKYIDTFSSQEFYDLVIQTNTIKPVYFCLYYCTQIYHATDEFLNIAERLKKSLSDMSFLNQYGFENGVNGIYTWESDLISKFFSINSVNEVKENAKCDIQKYSDYDTRIKS